MLNVLVTMPFTEPQLDRVRAVSPRLSVTRDDAETADYSRADVLYAVQPPRDLAGASRLRWVAASQSRRDTVGSPANRAAGLARPVNADGRTALTSREPVSDTLRGSGAPFMCPSL